MVTWSRTGGTSPKAGGAGRWAVLTRHHAFDVTFRVHAVLLCEVKDQLLCRLKLLGSHQPPEGLGEYPSKIQRELVNVF